jgi:hypothetical protein
MMITAVVVGLGAGWLLPAQQAPANSGPQWKSTEEYNEAQEYTKAKSDPERLAALDKWSKDFPNTEVWQTRDELYLTVYGSMKDYRKMFDRAKAARATHPEYYFAIQTILNVVRALNPVQPADLQTAEETGEYVINNNAKVFDAANKPLSVDAAQWPTFKEPVTKLAQRIVAWAAFQRKDYPKAERELTKVLRDDSTQAESSYFLGSTLFSERTSDQAKITPAIFHLARAASYTGQNALPQTSRTAALNSVTNIYSQYHGSKDGFEQVLELAKNNAFPPADFKIESINDIEAKKFANQQEYDKAHPDLAFWRDAVKAPLTGPNAEMEFNERYKDSELPPPGQTFGDKFKVKILSLTPETNPKEIVAALVDPNVADVKLTFDDPLPGTMMPGEELKFKGTVKAYQKEPFMVTFDIDPKTGLEGWTGKGAAKAGAKQATKGTGAQKGKGGAQKGK